jgi:hypothetical protein
MLHQFPRIHFPAPGAVNRRADVCVIVCEEHQTGPPVLSVNVRLP